MSDIFDLDLLLVESMLALGAALIAGNGWALLQERRGRRPRGAAGGLRRGRAWFLLGVGALIALWAVASLMVR